MRCALSSVNACSVIYTRAANTLMLLTDAGAAPGGTLTPGSGSQQNSQCVLNGAGSSVTTAGNVLTLNLAISFQGTFAGSRNIYLQAVNPFGTSGWQSAGTWTVTVGPAWAAVMVRARMAAVVKVRNMVLSFGVGGLVHSGLAKRLAAPVRPFVPASRRRIVGCGFEGWMVERGIWAP